MSPPPAVICGRGVRARSSARNHRRFAADSRSRGLRSIPAREATAGMPPVSRGAPRLAVRNRAPRAIRGRHLATGAVIVAVAIEEQVRSRARPDFDESERSPGRGRHGGECGQKAGAAAHFVRLNHARVQDLHDGVAVSFAEAAKRRARFALDGDCRGPRDRTPRAGHRKVFEQVLYRCEEHVRSRLAGERLRRERAEPGSAITVRASCSYSGESMPAVSTRAKRLKAAATWSSGSADIFRFYPWHPKCSRDALRSVRDVFAEAG